MKLLVVCPDYASHLLPLLQIASRWKMRHGDSVIATGPATRRLVEGVGVDWIDLRLGRGSNGGVIEASEQPVGEDDHLRAFFDATRRGPIETLRYQAEARRHDLLYDPDGVFERLAEIVRGSTRPCGCRSCRLRSTPRSPSARRAGSVGGARAPQCAVGTGRGVRRSSCMAGDDAARRAGHRRAGVAVSGVVGRTVGCSRRGARTASPHLRAGGRPDIHSAWTCGVRVSAGVA